MAETKGEKSQEDIERARELPAILQRVESGSLYAILESEKSRDLVGGLLEREEVGKHLRNLQEHHKDSLEHCLRVGLLAVDLAYERGLSDKDAESLGLAGLLHDLGKCDIAEDILSKDAELDADERKTIEEHPRRGFIALEEPEFEEVKQLVVGHHEFKRSSYPRGGDDRREGEREVEERRKDDERISGLTEILAAADIFDALASRRSYKKTFPKQKIKTTMTEQFTGDRRYVEQLLKRIT